MSCDVWAVIFQSDVLSPKQPSPHSIEHLQTAILNGQPFSSKVALNFIQFNPFKYSTILIFLYQNFYKILTKVLQILCIRIQSFHNRNTTTKSHD